YSGQDANTDADAESTVDSAPEQQDPDSVEPSPKPVLCPWSGLLLPCRTRTCRPVKLLRKFPSQKPLRRSRFRPQCYLPGRKTPTRSHRYGTFPMSNKKLPMRKKKSIRILE